MFNQKFNQKCNRKFNQKSNQTLFSRTNFSFIRLEGLLTCMLVLCLLMLQACGAGNGSSSDNGVNTGSTETGQVIIGLTDAPGDFLSYQVTVESITLTHSNGAVIETVPFSTVVDFAQYTELTEFLTAATVPSGVYTGAAMRLSYVSSEIIIEDEAGMGIPAVAIDDQGQPIETLEVSVELVNQETFRIAPGIPAHVTLDFDLAASHEVNLEDALVTVNPVFIVDTLLEDPKEHRVRGLLDEVAVEENVFSVSLRPFHRTSGNYGSLRVSVDDETSYEIDGESFVGSDGLTALASLEENAPIIALGALNRDENRFQASQVVAGSSVPWSDQDVARGHIIARSGDTLTLLGAILSPRDSRPRYRNTVTVQVGSDTLVKQQGSPLAELNKDDISIGQKVIVMGEMTALDDETVVLDAGAGRVQLRYTTLSAEVVSASPLIIDLQAIDRRRVALFDFTGTGASEDADPSAYEIDTSTLDTSSFVPNDPIKVRGFVNTFGEAPPDFSAKTIAAIDAVPAIMKVSWLENGTAAPFSASSNSAIVVNLENPELGRFHHVRRMGVITDLLDLGTDASLVPSDADSGIYVIAQRGAVQIFNSFSLFEAELAEELDGVTTLKSINGKGRFDDASVTLTSNRMTAIIVEPLSAQDSE